MGLKDLLKASVTGKDAEAGFRLPRPVPLHFKTVDGFHKAIKAQTEAMATVPGNDAVKMIDADGHVLGTDWQLSHAAFNDLCHWSRIPVTFIRLLAQVDEPQALDVVQTMLRSVFKSGVDKSLIIDSRENRIEGIVGTDTYSPISNEDVLNFAMSTAEGLVMTNGWLSGPHMRLTIVSAKLLEAKVGDAVRFGVNVENALHGDRSLKIADYMERLRCTNGAISRDKGGEVHIVHRGEDVEYDTQKAIVHASQRAEELLPRIRSAAEQLMLPNEIGLFAAFTKDNKQGGAESLWPKVVKQAKQEALDDGRKEEEVTLWNLVNGITQAAHDTPSLTRRGELEAMGYRALVRFGVALN
jgi:hypothetical protein